MISAAINTYLLTQSAVTNIVASRIYPVILPQKPTYPAITYRDDEHSFDESFDGQNGLVESFYEIDAWSDTYVGAETLATAVRAALMNYTGTMGNVTSIMRVRITSGPFTVYENTVGAYRQTQVFSIWHSEG